MASPPDAGATPTAPGGRPLVSIVVPVHNEAPGLGALLHRLGEVTATVDCAFEFVFVDDGSTDGTRRVLEGHRARDDRIGVVGLSRRFGKEHAVAAGLQHAAGDAVVLIDADLQDPPECLPAMIAAWQDGYDVVAMRRADRRVDGWFKRASAHAFYRLMNWVSDIEMPTDVGDFRLMSRRVVEVVNRLPETHRCTKGLFAWVGFRTRILDYTRAKRAAGDTKWPFLKLVGLAVDNVTAFSIAPLRLSTVLGFLVATFALVYGLTTAVSTVVFGNPVAGFSTTVALMTLIGGIQLIAIGVLGEYVGRTFIEVKKRPLYVVESVQPATRRTTAAARRDGWLGPGA
ncbi:MAG: glycosyltransferase family 2 protein [Pseudomonadota bacterium]